LRASAGRNLLGLLVAAAAGLVPAEAAAHQQLLRAEPAAGTAVLASPAELRLTFREAAELALTRIELIGPGGEAVPLGRPRAASGSAAVVLVPVHGVLAAGAYTVRWSTSSRDGHPVRGEYGFEVSPDTAGSVPVGGEPGAGATAPGREAPPAAHHPHHGAVDDGFRADSPGYVAVRWANFASLLGVVGSVSFALLVLGTLRRRGNLEERALIPEARARAATVGLAFAALLVPATLGRLYAQSLAMHGADHVLDAERIGTLLSRTVWGWGWILQGAATLVCVAGFALARRGVRGGWPLAALGALALAVTPALSGHAAVMPGWTGALAITADALHVLGAGGWLGALLVLLVAGLPAAARLGPARRGAGTAALVRAFSPAALLFASLLVLTGIVAIVLHTDSLEALLGSRYGTLLIVKLAIFLLVFATGAYNFLRVQPALGDDLSTGRLRRSAGLELAVAAAVLLVTAVLVATARPLDGEAGEATAAAPPALLALP
jgi:copper transport protein